MVIQLKKICALLMFIILLSGCQTKEITINNADGDSKTYKYFSKQKYNQNKYTLKLKDNNTNITIIRNKNKQYYESKNSQQTIKIIEKNNKKYTISSDYYTVEPLETLTGYSDGYLPESLKKYRKKSYKMGKERIGIINYDYEKYDYKDGTITYYFKKNNLKFIKKQNSLETIKLQFISITNQVNNNKFKLPQNKNKITY